MELAKITTKGQITIQIHIRKKLNLKDGDKVIFLEENGRVVMETRQRWLFARFEKLLKEKLKG